MTTRYSTPAAAAAAEARFAERLRSRRRTRWIRAGIGVLVAIVGLAGVWLVCFSSVFAVKSVHVAGTKRLDPQQVEQVAAVPHGGSLALLDTASIAARVRTLAPVAKVSVERKFPNTVEIDVTERVPVAVLDTPQGRELVDADGIAFAPAGDTGKKLMVVDTTQTTLAPSALVNIRQMIAALPDDVRAKVDHVEADTDQDMSVVLNDQRTVVWGGPEQPDFKARVLELLFRDKSTRAARTYDVSVPEAPVVKR